jgi:hypothetical protein
MALGRIFYVSTRNYFDLHYEATIRVDRVYQGFFGVGQE